MPNSKVMLVKCNLFPNNTVYDFLEIPHANPYHYVLQCSVLCKPWSGPCKGVNYIKTGGGRTLCSVYITSGRRTVRLGSLQGLYERFYIKNLIM